MTVAAKICGLTDAAAVAAAVENGAAYVGFVFYGPSPRNISPEKAAALTASVPNSVQKVGLFVDPSDDLIRQVLAIKIDSAASIADASPYEGVADMLLFDAKEPKTMKNALPGGNGLTFDWTLLADAKIKSRWMLAGGLNAENIAEAVRISGAHIVDTSSGVEIEPGRKDPAAIKTFLMATQAIETQKQVET